MSFGLLNILNIFGSISISTESFLCESNSIIDAIDSASTVWQMLVDGFLTLLGNLVYYVCQFALSIMDVIQIIVYKFLGISVDIEDFKVFDTNNPLIKFLTNDTTIDILKTITIVALVLVIVFTIFSILKGEWDKAANNTEYSVQAVWSRAGKALLGMLVFPATFMAVIIIVNALMASFSAAIGVNDNLSLGGQVFAVCSYDANVYRNYANNNKRIPIYIDFYDPYDQGVADKYSSEELAKVYDAFITDGTELYNKFATSDFVSFSSSLNYNSSTKSLTNDKSAYGEYEKFVCTAEQYQVMADFVDYAVANGITYYYKPVTDADIEWKYVSDSVFNKETGTLTISYRDSTNINDGKTYTVCYQPTDYDLGSPIKNAVGTLGTLLSLDENYYPMLEKLDGTIKQVAWATNKVYVKLSDNYNKFGADGSAQWTLMDQILLYEYYRYEYNNTFENYTINDLENGVYLDAYKIECQYYRSYSDSYITLKTYDVAIINDTYYLIEQIEETDDFGDPYYTIKNGDKTGTFLNNFSIYNEQNSTSVGVHIKALDNTDHKIVETNTLTYNSVGSKSKKASVIKINASEGTISKLTDYKHNDGTEIMVDDIDSVWYSATFTMQSEPTSCDNLLSTTCIADTTAKYTGIQIDKKDDNGNVVEKTYGFANQNGFVYEVDRTKATKQVKQVDWAHKLIGDIKTIYGDLNLSQLITTGQWLETFNSKIEQIDGEYVASFDTSLISPQGLIFSEIFLGVLQESDGSNLSNYMFSSKYSQEDKQELVLALCGIDKYETVSTTIDYFVDMFNQLFTPLLEKIMSNESQPFSVGEVTNVQLYTYKAYMCSLMLSSDSAGFFSDIADNLVLMYEFPYDIKVTDPNEYSVAVEIIKEYIFSNNVDNTQTVISNGETKTYTKDANQYGDGKVQFCLDMSLFEDIICQYLGDKDGVVTLQSLSKYYKFGDNLSMDEITMENTPNALLEKLNAKLDNCYLSFADIVIRENMAGEIEYGFEFDLSAFDGFKKVIKNNKTTYQFTSSYVYNAQQLSCYANLCEKIYEKVEDVSAQDCKLLDVLETINKNLEKQNVTAGTSYYPEYLTIFEQYINGQIEYQEIVLSGFVSKENVDGTTSGYLDYLKNFKSATKTLKSNTLTAAFISSINSSTLLRSLIQKLVGDSVEIPQSEIDKILAYNVGDEIVDFIVNLVGTLGGTLTDEELISNIYEWSGIKDLVDKFYDDQSTISTRYLSKDDLLNYSGLLRKEISLCTTVEQYKKQKLITKQLNAIINYAYNCPVYETELNENGELVQKKDANGNLVYTSLVAETYKLSGEEDKFFDLYNADGKKSTTAVISKHFVSYLLELANNWSTAHSLQNKIMEYSKYFITHTIKMNSTENIAKTFTVVINNRHYDLSVTMPTAKLTEYLLGGRYLGSLGYETVFVDQSYTGFFDIDYVGDQISRPDKGEANFNSIVNFLNEIADITVKSYYLSNLKEITKSNLDTQKLSSLVFADENGVQRLYAELVLDYVIDNQLIDNQTISSVLGISQDKISDWQNYDFRDSSIENVNNDITYTKVINSLFDSLLEYITGADKEFHSMSIKNLRLELMEQLVDFQTNSALSTVQNKNRYVALFDLFSGGFVSQNDSNVVYSVDLTTQNIIMKMAGVENMSKDMLFGLEYEDADRYFEGYDEQNGDVFIICTYDQEINMYIPFLMGNDLEKDSYVQVYDDGESKTWLDYGYGIVQTSYYSQKTPQPVVAKGIITEDGYPTAIRQIDGVVEFYRDNLTVRNASDLNLEAYYMTTEVLSTNYNLFSLITNSISKVVSGKTLIEHAYSSIPRFKISSDLNFPIGLDTYCVSLSQDSVTLTYNLTGLSGLSSSNFYKTTKINFLFLIIAIIALLPLLIKALFGVFGRVVDITVYYIMSPVMMSTIALGKNVDKGKEETKIFSTWYAELKKKTISVFGYVVGFQIFFLIIRVFSDIEFLSASAFDNLITLNPMLTFLQDWGVAYINRFVNLILIICSAYLITEAPSIFTGIMGQSNGFSDGATLKSNIKATLDDVKDSVNGTKVVNSLNFAAEFIKDTSGMNAINDVMGSITKTGAKVVGKGAEIYMRAHGVPKEQAKEIAKNMTQSVEKYEDNKKRLRDERRIRAYDAYFQQSGDLAQSKNVDKLQEIDNILYKNNLRNRSDEKHKAIQANFKNEIGNRKKEEKKAKKKK